MGVPLRPLGCFASLLVLLALTAGGSTAFAAPETFRGLLLPENRSPAIPISVELDRSRRQLSGRMATSAPLTGEGRVLSGEKKGYECNFKSDIGAGRTFTFTGYCLTDVLEGKYQLRMAEGTLLNGDVRLSRLEPEKKPDSEELFNPPLRSVAQCLTLNSACLAACPRTDYNSEFMCSNRCRQKFAACKGKATTALPAAAP